MVRSWRWIMNFELKTIGLSAAASSRCDALVVLVPEAFKPSTDAISRLVALARKSGDLDGKPGKLLASFGATGVTPPAGGGLVRRRVGAAGALGHDRRVGLTEVGQGG